MVGLLQGVLATGGVDLRMTMLGQKLQRAGVETHFYGKWHVEPNRGRVFTNGVLWRMRVCVCMHRRDGVGVIDAS